jgi:hypothetical protein
LVPVPSASRRWVPIGHEPVVSTVIATLEGSGLRVERQRFALSADDARLFGTLDVAVEVAPAVTLAVGVRNSLDQTFPLGFCAGHRVFVCDNLAFSAELMVRRKHTRFGAERFRDDIAQCVAKLEEFRLAERSRIGRMQSTPLSDVEAESFMLRAYERRLIGPRLLPRVIDEWREPTHEAFAARTLWSLFNGFTAALAERATSNPAQHARQSMALQALLSPRGADSPELMTGAPPKGEDATPSPARSA